MIYNWKKIVKNGLPILFFTAILEILAGQILQGKQELLYLFPIFLISFPVINSVSGNIGCVLGARLASGLHVGYVTVTLDDKEMHNNLMISLLIGFITYFILAILIYFIALFSNLTKGIGLIEFVSIIIITGFLLLFIISFISVLAAFISFKRGLDPDDIVAPVVTTAGDITGILFLFLILGLFGVGL